MGTANLIHHGFDARRRRAEGLARTSALLDRRMDHDQRGMSNIVIDDDVFGKHEEDVRETYPVRIRIGNLLDEAHPVVTDHPDCTADKTRKRKVRRWHDFECPQPFAKNLQRISLGFENLGLSVLDPLDTTSLRAENRASSDTEEAISRPFLTALDRFQQKGGLAIVDLAEERKWSV